MNLQHFYGISPQYLGTVESGENCLSIEKIVLLSRKANVTTDYILLGKENAIDKTLLKSISDLSETQLETSFSILKQILVLLKQ